MIRFLRSNESVLPDLRLWGRAIVLRPPRLEDWHEWSELRRESRAFLTPWEPTWPTDALSRSAFGRRLRRLNDEWRSGEGYAFHIFSGERGHLVGGIGLSNVRRGVAQTGTIGYWIGEPFARHGYMSDATGAILDYAFNELGLHRVEAACLPTNEASRRLLEKLGFVREGYAREYLKINGVWADHLLFAILRTDRT